MVTGSNNINLRNCFWFISEILLFKVQTNLIVLFISIPFYWDQFSSVTLNIKLVFNQIFNSFQCIWKANCSYHFLAQSQRQRNWAWRQRIRLTILALSQKTVNTYKTSSKHYTQLVLINHNASLMPDAHLRVKILLLFVECYYLSFWHHIFYTCIEHSKNCMFRKLYK